MANKNQFPSEADVKRQRTIANCEKAKNGLSTAGKFATAAAAAISVAGAIIDAIASCANNSQK